MRKFFLLLLLSPLISLASNSDLREMESFIKLNITGPIEVEYEPGDTYSVHLQAKGEYNLENIVTKVEKNELKINVSKGKTEGMDLLITVTAPELKEIRSATGAKLICHEMIEIDHVELRAFAGGEIWLKYAAKSIEATVNQGGHITIFGNTDKLIASVNTGGTIAATHCVAQNAEARVKAGGDIFTQPVRKLDAKVTAGGTIHYYGDPEEEKTKTTLGGSIEAVKKVPEFREDF